MVDILLNKLEEIKQAGNYAVSVHYGGDVGVDDIDTPQDERIICISMVPVGFVGEIKVLFTGTLIELAKLDVKSKPKKISNPPDHEQVQKPGFYCWGTDRSIYKYLVGFRKKIRKH